MTTFWHQSCTAKMGQDALSVIDRDLKVYGTKPLRVTDASILSRVATGNTMAPCVVIGERAASILQQAHGTWLSSAGACTTNRVWPARS